MRERQQYWSQLMGVGMETGQIYRKDGWLEFQLADTQIKLKSIQKIVKTQLIVLYAGNSIIVLTACAFFQSQKEKDLRRFLLLIETWRK